MKSQPLTVWGDLTFADSCAYLVTFHGGTNAPCGEPTRFGSSYCPEHHMRCHLRRGSRAEALEFEQIERDACG